MSVGTLNLPGAENFAKFLEEKAGNVEVSEEPEAESNSDRWHIFFSGRQGQYVKFLPCNNDEMCKKMYFGPHPLHPAKTIILIYDRHTVRGNEIIETPWQRQDEHTEIPFP